MYAGNLTRSSYRSSYDALSGGGASGPRRREKAVI